MHTTTDWAGVPCGEHHQRGEHRPLRPHHHRHRHRLLQRRPRRLCPRWRRGDCDEQGRAWQVEPPQPASQWLLGHGHQRQVTREYLYLYFYLYLAFKVFLTCWTMTSGGWTSKTCVSLSQVHFECLWCGGALGKAPVGTKREECEEKYVITIITIITIIISVIFIMITIKILEKRQLAVAQSVASMRRGRGSHFWRFPALPIAHSCCFAQVCTVHCKAHQNCTHNYISWHHQKFYSQRQSFKGMNVTFVHYHQRLYHHPHHLNIFIITSLIIITLVIIIIWVLRICIRSCSVPTVVLSNISSTSHWSWSSTLSSSSSFLSQLSWMWCYSLW